ncbi:MAG: hypothetical protein WBN15_06620, partial [Polyangiales bacterium]
MAEATPPDWRDTCEHCGRAFDASGLHLTTVQRAEKWYCTEVVLQQSLGYGTYEFRLGSRVD